MARNGFFILILLVAACSKQRSKDLGTPNPFLSCADIQAYVDKVVNQSHSGDGASGPVSAQGDGVGSGAHLNLQEQGVDESDMLRIEAKFLFVAHLGGVEVIERKSLKHLGLLDTGNIGRMKLFSDGKTLTVIGNPDWKNTRLMIYRIQEYSLPTLEKQIEFKGNLVDSRSLNRKIILVLRDYDTVTYGAVPRIKLDSEGTLSGIPCDCIEAPSQYLYNFGLTKIISVDLDDLSTTKKAVGFLGGADQVYMSVKNLYVSGRDKLVKVRVDETSGRFGIVARGKLDGWIKDRWAFKELSGELLAIASTSHTKNSNLFSIYEQEGEKLKVVARSPEFGHTEDIRAVRYVDNIAYAVTFKKTDPLFAIDFKDPRSPKLIGELKVPGFSAYLHPFKNGKLVGVGFDAEDLGMWSLFQGVKISLFNVQDPMNLKELDHKIYGSRGSYSDPTTDAHAFFSDPEKNRIGIPLVEINQSYQLTFSGAVLYEVDEKLTETTRLTHSNFIPDTCKKKMSYGIWSWGQNQQSYDINRLVKLDGKLLSVSRFGLVAHDDQCPSEEREKVFFSNIEETKACETNSQAVW